MVASNPPADPPTPTIGHATSLALERRVRRADFALFRPALAFVRDALFFAVFFAAMAAFFMVIPPAHHTSIECGGTRPQLARCGEAALAANTAKPPDFELRLRRGMPSPSEKSIHLSAHSGGTRPPGALGAGVGVAADFSSASGDWFGIAFGEVDPP
jgi:hypothetical protein